jgi:hypothetical protein
MAITAQSIVKSVVEVLQDPTNVRWKIADIARYFNDGRRQIILHRPDAGSTEATLALVAGVRQTLPANGASLMDVKRNSTGAKRAVTPIRDRKILDAIDPDWPSMTGASVIEHFMYDERDALAFMVYPPAALGASIDILYSAYPADITIPGPSAAYSDVTGNLGLPDVFGNAMTDYCLYRCYAIDNEFSPDPQRADKHLTLFASALGVEIDAILKSSPRAMPGA